MNDSEHYGKVFEREWAEIEARQAREERQFILCMFIFGAVTVGLVALTLYVLIPYLSYAL